MSVLINGEALFSQEGATFFTTTGPTPTTTTVSPTTTTTTTTTTTVGPIEDFNFVSKGGCSVLNGNYCKNTVDNPPTYPLLWDGVPWYHNGEVGQPGTKYLYRIDSGIYEGQWVIDDTALGETDGSFRLQQIVAGLFDTPPIGPNTFQCLLDAGQDEELTPTSCGITITTTTVAPTTTTTTTVAPTTTTTTTVAPIPLTDTFTKNIGGTLEGPAPNPITGNPHQIPTSWRQSDTAVTELQIGINNSKFCYNHWK
jgi:hypothetical protein